MTYSINDDNTIIKIYFKKPFYKNLFNELYFTPNKNIVYYDKSHINYIYVKIIDDIKYTFYGFFKDNFFTIIFDSYDDKLQVNIENKYLIIIKLDWELLDIGDNKSLWILDYVKLHNLSSDAYILNIRKRLLETQYINIEQYMKISDYEKNNIQINLVNKIDENNEIKNNRIKTFFSLINCNNYIT